LLHWYDNSIPNWIITIWQLLPNIPKNWAYSSDLLYLEKNWKKVNANSYIHNSFLEDLNKRESIDTMFSNISGKFTSYYSEVTWSHDKNNIIWYKISESYNSLMWTKLPDLTDIIGWWDIYSKYSPVANKYAYNISENVRNSLWLWWDGTVPSKNLKLVANDSYDPSKDNNKKFESKLIKCYDQSNPLFIESKLTSKIWDVEMELCSHSKMPMLTAVNVYEQISWNSITKIKTEQELLYSYLWYADYNTLFYVIKNGVTNSWFWQDIPNATTHKLVSWGVQNNTYLSTLFWEGVYNNMFKNNQSISKFINDRKGADRQSLDFSWKIWQVYSLLRYEILSPINLIIEDEQWRKIWIDPETWMIINEIPWAWTSWNTEWSNEPEFFLIPKYGTWQTLHKLNSYGTGDWEYHIAMNEIKTDPETSSGSQLTSTWTEEKTASFVIAWTATKWIVENYVVWIQDDKASYKLINSEVSTVLKKAELKEKYKDILEKLYKILDKKYSKQKKTKLKQNLIKFRENNKYKDDEKITFLIDMIIEHIK
jgi:hypothetical protein